jgi:transcriptional regulator GlxA family with amidase domain
MFYFCSNYAMTRLDIEDMASAILSAPGWARVGITAPARHIRDDAAQELARSIAEALMHSQQRPEKDEQPALGL